MRDFSVKRDTVMVKRAGLGCVNLSKQCNFRCKIVLDHPAHRAFTVVWLVLGLGYMFMITEHLSEGEYYVELLRKVSKKIGKKFKRVKQRNNDINNSSSNCSLKRVNAIRIRSKSLRVTFPEDKANNPHKKLCVSASV